MLNDIHWSYVVSIVLLLAWDLFLFVKQGKYLKEKAKLKRNYLICRLHREALLVSVKKVLRDYEYIALLNGLENLEAAYTEVMRQIGDNPDED